MKAERTLDTYSSDKTKLNGQGKPGADTGTSFIPPKETHFSIKDLADFSGIKPHTIRIWEQRFPFLSPQRTETSRRFYTGQQVIFFLQICLLKQNGYRMTHIAQMSNEERNAIITDINGAQKYVKIVFELITCMIKLDTILFNNLLDKCVRDWGIHETLQCVILPFAERTCLFDNPEKKTYRVNLFLVLECIKQKIYLGIESSVSELLEPSTIFLFPAGPAADLLPLYLHYLVKKEGFKTIYLGKYSSFEELNMICTSKKPDFIISHLTENYRSPDLVEFLKGVADDLPHSHLISTGRPLSADKRVQNYHYVENPPDIISLLNSLQKRSG